MTATKRRSSRNASTAVAASPANTNTEPAANQDVDYSSDFQPIETSLRRSSRRASVVSTAALPTTTPSQKASTRPSTSAKASTSKKGKGKSAAPEEEAHNDIDMATPKASVRGSTSKARASTTTKTVQNRGSKLEVVVPADESEESEGDDVFEKLPKYGRKKDAPASSSKSVRSSSRKRKHDTDPEDEPASQQEQDPDQEEQEDEEEDYEEPEVESDDGSVSEYAPSDKASSGDDTMQVDNVAGMNASHMLLGGVVRTPQEKGKARAIDVETKEESEGDDSEEEKDSVFMTPVIKQKGAAKRRSKPVRKPVVKDEVEEGGSEEGEEDQEVVEEDMDKENRPNDNGSDGSSDSEEAAPRARRQRGTRRVRPKKPSAQERILTFHPELATVWQELENYERAPSTDKVEQPQEITIKLLPFQLEGVNWLRNQEESRFNGGILADEMGMGKTIQVISLLVTKRHIKPNLILTPTVAILQWLAEIKERVAPDLLKVYVYHGQNREASAAKLAAYDIVLSTYSIVEAGYRKQTYGVKRHGELKKEKSLLHSIDWGRVILDEAHSIKDRSCSTARAVFNLKGRFKWSVTGTPLQNRVGELYSLIRFMGADGCGHTGHQHFCWWNAEILKPIQNYGGSGPGLEAFGKLKLLLDNIMLRRTKVERADDLGLPPRVVVVRKDVFNEAEEELYESLYTDSKRQFSTYVNSHTVLNNYASIFSLLSRMRLAVNHPDLVTTKMAIAANNAKENLVCGICQDPAEDAVISKCKHIFCREDVRQYMLAAPDGKACTCPTCFRPLSIDLSQPEYDGGKKGDSAKTSIVNYIDMSKWRSSTKIEALVEELTALQRDDSTMKSIVFSQFVAFLDLIQWRLARAGFTCVRLDGRMTPQARDTVIQSFMTDPAVTVFLVSLKAGGVALNLTEASRVFILDPWWNPAAEDQAFDRIHRLGQTRPIKITRLIIENSIESRILQLQEKKKMLFQSTVGKDIDALAKLSEEDFSMRSFTFVITFLVALIACYGQLSEASPAPQSSSSSFVVCTILCMDGYVCVNGKCVPRDSDSPVPTTTSTATATDTGSMSGSVTGTGTITSMPTGATTTSGSVSVGTSVSSSSAGTAPVKSGSGLHVDGRVAVGVAGMVGVLSVVGVLCM
ncbi:DNA repair protein rad16 [Blyttiomyces sp. JEL0837]|nr:DNA repair protein rad16 [Blyttiomyces sp. JEL0837]